MRDMRWHGGDVVWAEVEVKAEDDRNTLGYDVVLLDDGWFVCIVWVTHGASIRGPFPTYASAVTAGARLVRGE